MDYQQLIKFCMNQKSITEAMFNFIDRFMECYEDEDPAEQEILTQCVQQMFRKYYYSTLDPEMLFTPAKIVNTLCEREFGSEYVVVPYLNIIYKNKKISRLQYDFTCVRRDNHPMVKDLEFFLETASTGIRMESPGIPFSSEYTKLKKLWIYDRHYINIISLIALKAGYIECMETAKGLTGKRTAKAEEFFSLDKAQKLEKIIESAVALCSHMIIEVLPELGQEFTIKKVAGFLVNPQNYESSLAKVFKRLGMNLKNLNTSLSLENLAETLQTIGFNADSAFKLSQFNTLLDIYFFTPFGYYLQIIQPVYPDLYDINLEFDELLTNIDNFNEVRNKLFTGAIDYDLTALGANSGDEGMKPKKGKRIPENIGDREMFQAVLASLDYIEEEDEAVAASEEELNEFIEFMENLERTPSAPKSRTGKVIDFPAPKSLNSTSGSGGKNGRKRKSE